MATKVAMQHSTLYEFDREVIILPHQIRLRPAPHCRTPISDYHLLVQPVDHQLHWQQDPFANHLARVFFPTPAKQLLIQVDLHADMTPINPFEFFIEQGFERYPFRYDEDLHRSLMPYLEITESTPTLQSWVDAADLSEQGSIEFLAKENRRTCAAISYKTRMQAGVYSCEETLRRAEGSCRDSAWLLAQTLRHLGLATRFASGYLIQLDADQGHLTGDDPLDDFSDLHAWTEVYIPGAGWIGLDPTSGLFASEGHIPLACTPYPAVAAPISGNTEPCTSTMTHSSTIRRLSRLSL